MCTRLLFDFIAQGTYFASGTQGRVLVEERVFFSFFNKQPEVQDEIWIEKEQSE